MRPETDQPFPEESGATQSKLYLYQHDLILKNGHKTQHGNENVITVNTCGFDTIFSTFTCSYFDNLEFREQIDSSQSKLASLMKMIFVNANKSASQKSNQTEMKRLYDHRNSILEDIYSNWCKNSYKKINNSTFIDCFTGLGGLFARICLKLDANFCSAIEEKTCHKCRTKKFELLPFLTIQNVKNLEKINGIDLSFSNKLCTTCKNDCDMQKLYNNILVLEVEPRNQIRNTTIAIYLLCSTLEVKECKYQLFAAMHYDPKMKHFTSYVRRLDNNWYCYDDTKKLQVKTKESTHINPFLLCYMAINWQTDFAKSAFFQIGILKYFKVFPFLFQFTF